MAIPAAIRNSIIKAFYEQMQDWALEISSSVSADTGGANGYDVERWRAEIADRRAFLNYVKARMEPGPGTQLPSWPLDMPETKDKLRVIDPWPVIPDVENTMVQYFLEAVTDYAEELVNSQSARSKTEIQHHDMRRIESYLSDAERFIDYLEERSPLDHPASAPEEAATPSGRGGV